MPSPQISILVPCFNSGRFVGEALRSVLDQSFTDFEVIVVDDGSTDPSWSVINEVHDERLRAFRIENGGAAAARNYAFSKSSAPYVIYFDADDLLGEDHLASLHRALAPRQDSVAIAPWARFQNAPSETRFDKVEGATKTGVDWLFADWTDTQPMTQPGMFLIPREMICKFGGWDERLSLADDFEFFARILSHAEEVRPAPAARLYYRSAISGSLSGRKSRAAIESQQLTLLLGTQHLLDAEESPRTRRACANILKQFDYEHYPHHPDLRAKIQQRVDELGGADIAPIGPPRFHQLRRYVGWRAARRIQKLLGR